MLQQFKDAASSPQTKWLPQALFLNPTFSFVLACVFSYPPSSPPISLSFPLSLCKHAVSLWTFFRCTMFCLLFLSLLFLFYCTCYDQCVSHCSYSPFGSASILLFLKLRVMIELLGYDADIHCIICEPLRQRVFSINIYILNRNVFCGVTELTLFIFTRRYLIQSVCNI